MYARAQVVCDVVGQHAVKALCVHHDHMIEALASDRADDAFHVGVCHGERGAVRTVWMFIPARVIASSVKTESRSCSKYSGASLSGNVLRSCCAVQAAVGCSVTATWTIRRRSCAKMTRTKSSRKVTDGTTKRSAAMIWLA